MAMPDMFDLAGRVALVTGASRGIGAAIAEGLANAGAHVIGLSRSGAGGKIDHRPCDVADPAAVAALMRGLEKDIAALDILVNAAGISLPPGGDEVERMS